MKQETKITNRRANRHSVTEMVTAPAKSAAWYRGALFAGVAIVGGAGYMAKMDAITAAGVMGVIGAFLVGVGWGGDSAMRRNFNVFAEYVLDSFIEDRTETTETTGERPSGTKVIPVTQNGVRQDLELSDGNPLADEDWQAIAQAIMVQRITISETALVREARVTSQPKYRQFYSYMTGNKYLLNEQGKNALTGAGERYLNRWL
jgi:hypothetical protein